MDRWFDVGYVVVHNDDDSYEWKRLTGSGVGVPPYEGLPKKSNPNGKAGLVNAYSKDDHVHPHDITKQDLLYNPDGTLRIPLRTINGQKWWEGNGNIVASGYYTITDGVNKIEHIKINGTEYEPVDKIVTIPFKTINGESIYGEGDINIPTDFESIKFTDRLTYNYSNELRIPIYDGAFRRV